MADERMNVYRGPIDDGRNLPPDDTFAYNFYEFVHNNSQVPHAILFITVFAVSFFSAIYFSSYIIAKNKAALTKPALPVEVCNLKSCNDSAKFLQKSLDRSVRPCSDFHKFVCNKFMALKFHLVHKDIKDRLISVMDLFDTLFKTHGSSDYLSKLQQYYSTCVDKFLISKQNLLEKFDKLGGWPMANKQNLWRKIDLEWMGMLHKFYKAGLKINFIIDIDFPIHPENITKRELMLKAPKKKTMINFQSIDKNFIDLINSVLGLEQVQEDYKNMVDFERELKKLAYYGEKNLDDVSRSTIVELQIMFPKINWLEFLNGFLSPHAEISAIDEVAYTLPYLEQLYNLMIERHPPSVVVINYFYWQNVIDFHHEVLFDPSSMKYTRTEHVFKNVNFRKRRKEICMSDLMQNMDLAISALFIRNFSNEDNVRMAAEMSERMRRSLYQNVEKVNWLGGEVRKKILSKINGIKLLVGYPHELLNDTLLDDYYQDLTFSKDEYVQNYWNLQRFQRIKKIQAFTRPVDREHWTEDFGKVATTTAVYMAQNVMLISGGMLHPLLFDVHMPNYMNYGMLGAIVSHELAHALDAEYIFYDENNDFIEDPWEAKKYRLLQEEQLCLINKYSNYEYTDISLRVDGNSTLVENMADAIGLKAAYDAYVSLMEDKPEEPCLPGLKDFNNKQMFWIAYASMFCKKEQDLASILKVLNSGTHTPSEFRVNGALSNMPGFAQDFECKLSDVFMNPVQRCFAT